MNEVTVPIKKTSLKKDGTPRKKYNIKPTARALQVAKIMSEDVRISKGEAMRKAGYAVSTSKSPTRVTETKSWEQLMDEFIPESLVAETHKGLMTAMAVDHQSFSLGFRSVVDKMKYIEELEEDYKNAKDEQPEEEDEDFDEDGEPIKKKKSKKKLKTKEQIQEEIRRKIIIAEESLTDTDIKALFEGVGCTVKKIIHREMSRDVYYYTPDNRARKDAVDMANKLRSKYGGEGGKVIFNNQIIIGMKISSDNKE